MPDPLFASTLLTVGSIAAAGQFRPSSAISEEARNMHVQVCKVVQHYETSNAIFGEKSALLQQLEEIAAECAILDWDGYGAYPVSAVALARARNLIRMLPSNIPLPELSVDPEGDISLDWMPHRVKTFSISVGNSNRLAYAWVDGTDRGHAVASMWGDGGLPLRLIRELNAFLDHESTVRLA